MPSDTRPRRTSGAPARESGAARAVVIGIGNEFRHDDGIGAAVVRKLTRCSLRHVELAITDGESSRLLDLWAGADLAVVIDAMHTTPAEPGRLHRVVVDRSLTKDQRQASSHGLGLGEAVDLAFALDRLPRRLVILAVEGANFDVGTGLTAPVNAALDRIVQLTIDEIDRCGSLAY